MLALWQSCNDILGCESSDLLRLHIEGDFLLHLTIYRDDGLTLCILDAYILNLELHILVVRSAGIIEWLGNTADSQVGCIAGCLVELHIVDGEPVLILVAEGIEAQIDGLWLVKLDYLERFLVNTLLNGLLINLVGHIGRGIAITIIYAQLLGMAVGTGIPVAQYVVASLYLHWVENCPVVGIVLLIIIIGETGYACACHIHPKVRMQGPVAIILIEVIVFKLHIVLFRLKSPCAWRSEGTIVAHGYLAGIVGHVVIISIDGVYLDFVVVAWLREICLGIEGIFQALASLQGGIHILYHWLTVVNLISYLEVLAGIEADIGNSDLHGFCIRKIITCLRGKQVGGLQIDGLVDFRNTEVAHIELPLVGRTEAAESYIERLAFLGTVDE